MLSSIGWTQILNIFYYYGVMNTEIKYFIIAIARNFDEQTSGNDCAGFAAEILSKKVLKYLIFYILSLFLFSEILWILHCVSTYAFQDA